MKKIQGILFDMDNTLLQSRIDFDNMKKETFRFLADQGILSEDFPIEHHTTSTMIDEAGIVDFIAYRADRASMKQRDVVPKAYISDIREVTKYLS